MKVSKINQMLILTSVVAVVLVLARGDWWGKDSIVYLIWNLFLAYVPYVISSCLVKKNMPVKHFVPVFIFWLLFFPNAPYLVTDVLHIADRVSPLLWYNSLLFFFFGWIGLLLGMLSLRQMHKYFQTHFSSLISELIIFAICLISSFGVYLGRFGRWNSWDVFFNPSGLIRHSFNVSGGHMGTPILFVSIFTIFMYLTYKTIFFANLSEHDIIPN